MIEVFEEDMGGGEDNSECRETYRTGDYTSNPNVTMNI